jgi:quinol---cytochrome c reductase iron-sulfur subunit, bacillus type
LSKTDTDFENETISQMRRKLLSGVSVLLSLIAGSLVAAPVIGFLIAPFLRPHPRVWRAVGKVEDFNVGDTVQVTFLNSNPLPWDGFLARYSAWLRRESEGYFVAFCIDCTHLGCPVRWENGAQLFLCPCHGGVYNRSGEVVAGPPPRALIRYPVRVENGFVEILTTPIPLV